MAFRAAAEGRRRLSLAAVGLLATLLLSPTVEASRGLPAALAPALASPSTPNQVLEATLSDPPARLRLFDDLRLPPRPLELVEARITASGVSTWNLGLNRLQIRGLSRNRGGLSFQGQWTDPVTGISYARNRWYDARTASWLSEDPLGAVDSPNLYAFVGWQPHTATDPLGLINPNGAQGQVVRQAGRALSALRDFGVSCWRGMSGDTGEQRFIQGCIEARVDAGAAHMSTRVQQSTALGGSVGEGVVVALAEMMTPFGALVTAGTGEVPYEGPVDGQARVDAGFDAFFAVAEFGLGLKGGSLFLKPAHRGLDLDLDVPSGLDFVDEGNRRVQFSREGIAESHRLVALDDSQARSSLLPYKDQPSPRNGNDAHHIIQDARARELEGYMYDDAPTDLMEGPAFIPATAHGGATAMQSMINRILRSKGHTTMTYRRARGALQAELRAAGRSPEHIADALRLADSYFIDELGITMDTLLRVPER